ncbi:E3 SUMO-protein ligase nse2 [Hondaea fermentalgiana]|uniref:E3 SUMO-protein ligase nse2 n=1 Tax=Hondaea fermentalgiana TaxID=2315210 RepID=A0A2R5GNI8_9STRA|nr:E3 SUMO-protein ligase nse2 [Hondaea fermentalgiana]|eukprot:GBG32457.1 E3 SUMO-protein ligase nse2 [Hondaea fermentalgiana]
MAAKMRANDEDIAEKNEEELLEARNKQKQELVESLREVEKNVRTFLKSVDKAAEEVLNGGKTIQGKFEDMHTALKNDEIGKEFLEDKQELRDKLYVKVFRPYCQLVEARIQTERKLEAIKQVLQIVQDWRPQDFTSEIPDAEKELQDRFLLTTEKVSDQEIRVHALYKDEWRGYLPNMLANDEDDDVEVDNDNEVNDKCPVLLEPLDNPLKSVKCNHVISAKGVEFLFPKGTRLIKCPVAGCVHQLKKSDFQHDERLEKRIQYQRDRKRRDLELTQPPDATNLAY